MAIKTCDKKHIMHYRGIVQTDDKQHQHHLWICGLCQVSKTFELTPEEVVFWRDTNINHRDFENFLEHNNWYDAGNGIYFNSTDVSQEPMSYDDLIEDLYDEYKEKWKGTKCQ